MFGILCGLHSEAKIADRIPDVLVACSEARAERAAEMARYMVRQGVSRLVSFGLAGALAPEMEAGDLILGATVVSDHGAWEVDGAWNMRMMNHLSNYHCAPVFGSDKLVATPKAKQACMVRTGCLAVDMESHIVAEIATRAKIPFNIVRAVADTSDMTLPPAALVPLGADGRVDLHGIFASLKKQPAQIPDVIRLARYSMRAHKALKEAVEAMRKVSS